MLEVSLPVLIMYIPKTTMGSYTGMSQFAENNYLAEAVRIKLTRNLGNILLERTPSEKMYLGSYAVALKHSYVLRSVITAKVVKMGL